MFKAFRFPAKTSGAILSLNKDKMRVSCILDPFDIVIDCSNYGGFYEKYCEPCEHHASISDIEKAYKQVVGKSIEEQAYWYSMQRQIRDDFAKECEFCSGGDDKVTYGGCYKNYNPVEVLRQSITINVPKLIIRYNSASSHRWSMLAANDKNQFYSYRLANVYSSGTFCWGSARGSIKDHLGLFNKYFTSSFNSDLAQGKGQTPVERLLNYNHSEYMKEHDATGQTLEEVVKFNTETLRTAAKKVRGVIITDDGPLHDLIPTNYHYRAESDRTYVVGWINKTANGFLLNCKGLLAYSKTISAKSKFDILGAKDEIF